MKKFCDLLWTIRTVQEYESKYQCQLTRSHLLRLLENSFLGGRRIKTAQPVLKLLCDLKLLGINHENQVFVMSRGNRLSELGSGDCYELNIRQKKLLTPWYVSSACGIFKKWITYFSINDVGILHATRSQIVRSLQQWTEEMLYLGVVVQSNEHLEFFAEYAWMRSFSIEKLPMTLEELQTILELQAIAGRKAEEYVLLFEKQRLREQGLIEEADRVERISDELVNAGYDILSFSTPGSEPNRFIEVKSVNEDQSFYWSRNELEVARVLGEQYYLYLVNQDNPFEPTVKIIENPYTFLSLNAHFEPVQYQVSFL